MTTHGNDWVKGRTNRYMCNTIEQVDSHIRQVCKRYAAALSFTAAIGIAGDLGRTPREIETARRTYVTDSNVLLNARVMLQSLATLEADIAEFFGHPSVNGDSMPILPGDVDTI